MNERINDFVGQAKVMAEETINKKIPKNAELDAFAEKFSELIVQHCVDIMENCFAGSNGTDDQKEVWGSTVESFKAWNGAIKFSRDKIKNTLELKNDLRKNLQ